MLNPEKEVYLGELVTPNAESGNLKPYVTWRSTKAQSQEDNNQTQFSLTHSSGDVI
jgi:hypothetical protein